MDAGENCPPFRPPPEEVVSSPEGEPRGRQLSKIDSNMIASAQQRRPCDLLSRWRYKNYPFQIETLAPIFEIAVPDGCTPYLHCSTSLKTHKGFSLVRDYLRLRLMYFPGLKPGNLNVIIVI